MRMPDCDPQLITRDYLPGSRLPLLQRRDMFRINTDTVLLAGFMKIMPQDTVLDIGTNNGALLLEASQAAPKKLCGIDKLPEAVELAGCNLELNGILNAELNCIDLMDFHHEPFDVILCNPPYFKTEDPDSRNASVFLRTARHEDCLTPAVLFECAGRLLKDKGRFYLVHRASRLADLFCALKPSPLSCRRLRLVYDSRTERAGAVLMELGKGDQSELQIDPPQWIK